MKTGILASALALVMWGGVAVAGDKRAGREDCVDAPGAASSSTQGLDTQEGVGGAGQEEWDVYGGSGEVGTEEQDIGGSGEVGSDIERDMDTQAAPLSPAEPVPQDVPAAPPAPTTAIIIDDRDEEEIAARQESAADMKGLTLLLGGGVEGYSGDLAPAVNPGAAWGVSAAIKPTSVLGLELSYLGAANELDLGAADNLTSGADVVRNGGEAVATFGLAASAIQPYVLGGIGFSHYNVREGEGTAGFTDDTSGSVPVGAGLRTHFGDFTADARLAYSFLFDQEFAPAGDNDFLGADNFTDGGRYTGMIRVGTTF